MPPMYSSQNKYIGNVKRIFKKMNVIRHILYCWLIICLNYSIGLSITTKDSIQISKILTSAENLRYKQTSECIGLCYRALEMSRKKNYNYGIAQSRYEMGKAYFLLEDYENSLKNIVASINISEKEKFTSLLALAYGGLANIYIMQLNHKQAIRYLHKSIDLYKITNNLEGMTNALNNIGYSYYKNQQVDSCLTWYNKSLKLANQIQYHRGICNTLQNIGHLYYDTKNFDSARVYYTKSLAVSNMYYDIQITAKNYFQLAKIESTLNHLKEAQTLLDSALLHAKKQGVTELYCNLYKELSLVYEKQHDLKQAYTYSKLYYTSLDSLNQFERSKKVNQDQFNFEMERKMKEQEILDQQKAEAHRKEIQQQNIIIYSTLAGLIAIGVLLLLIYRNFKNKKRANQLLEEKNLLIEEQKKAVEEKNKEIIDSINYAKRLQEAILPPEALLEKHIGHYFILYQPKDIVAGDFYWMETMGDKVMIAAADCTGHGVPGAMVSVVCAGALTRTVKEFGLTNPGKILDKTTELVVDTLAKNKTDVKDGMDISLCSIDFNKKSLVYSGANNPLWICRKNHGSGLVETIELKANKQPVGQFEFRKPFEEHSISLQPGDCIYLFTDGYADQFGGPHGKKFKYTTLKQLLQDIHPLTMPEQKEKLLYCFDQWKGNLEQLDDVCIIGVRV